MTYLKLCGRAHDDGQANKMSQSGSEANVLERLQTVRREKNRIAQQKHREKRKNNIKKMMTILQKVKLAATKNDIGQVQLLVSSPTIVLPAELSPTSVPSLPANCTELEDIFPAQIDCFSSPKSTVEVVTSTTTGDGAIVEQSSNAAALPPMDEMVSLTTPNFFQPSMDPLFWNMGSLFPAYQLPYLDPQTSLQLLQPLGIPNHWESYPAIMAGM